MERLCRYKINEFTGVVTLEDIEALIVAQELFDGQTANHWGAITGWSITTNRAGNLKTILIPSPLLKTWAKFAKFLPNLGLKKLSLS